MDHINITEDEWLAAIAEVIQDAAPPPLEEGWRTAQEIWKYMEEHGATDLLALSSFSARLKREADKGKLERKLWGGRAYYRKV